MALDPVLAAAIKTAKGKKMYFAFIPKGSGDGKLIVRKTRIPAKEIAEAKKELGGGNAITGKCTGPLGEMVFETAKAAPATIAAAVKKVSHRDAGMAIIATFQLAADADAEEESTESEASETGAPPVPPATPAPDAAAPAAGGGTGTMKGIQTALKKLGYDPGAIDGVTGPHTQAAIKKFQEASGLAADGIAGPKTQAALAKALQAGGASASGGATPPPTPSATTPAPDVAAPTGGKVIPGTAAAHPKLAHWKAARQEAIKDLKALAAKVAATKHDTAANVLKEIQSIISRLPDSPAANELDKLEEFVRHDDTISAAEDVPGHFHNLSIRKPLLDALEAMKS